MGSPNGYKCFSPFLNHYFVYADVTFSESFFYFKSPSYSIKSPCNTIDIPSLVNILVICDLLGVPCMPSISTPPSLQVYSRCHSPQQPLSDSTQVPTIVSPPHPIIESFVPQNDLLIAPQRGIRSTHNISPHSITLSYHRLSSPLYMMSHYFPLFHCLFVPFLRVF